MWGKFGSKWLTDYDDDIGVINIRYSRSGHGEAAHESLHDGDDEEDNDEPGGALLTSRTHRSLRRRYCCEQCNQDPDKLDVCEFCAFTLGYITEPDFILLLAKS